ncbi:uncharacterized protein LOC110699988 [Chenopodium quinoa]|uniref:uncharacterized protein LOC110699988 n=1 Tax=Chenopodium quinoa TaxID=63459 RepID=UPI000B78E2A7|nr:uncharacterized protein LOC110699988 [Chenopodium quinoa]
MLNINYFQLFDKSWKKSNFPPWKLKNKRGDTPLHLALYSKHEKIALEFLYRDSTLCQICNKKGESPLFVGVAIGCAQVVERILRILEEPEFNILRRNDGQTVLHLLKFCTEETAKQLLSRFWWIINVRNNEGKTALDEANNKNVPWLMELLRNLSAIQIEPFNWIKACLRGDKMAVISFIENYQYVPEDFRVQNDIPLHHIKLQSYQEYQEFLKNPSIRVFKNTIDFQGGTPLHQALKRKHLQLAKTLLMDSEVMRQVKDNHGTTAMDILDNLCKKYDYWAHMCRSINVFPNLKTIYIHPEMNIDKMQHILSPVAAVTLLATITLAVGFTISMSLKSQDENVSLVKKFAFLAFLLADIYGMSTSILVLFCLIWSMVSTPDMMYFLVNRSLLLLMQALYSTMVAFMASIYIVVLDGILWAVITIIFIHIFIGISANRMDLLDTLAIFVFRAR